MNPPKVKLRKATAADIPLLKKWDEQPHVIESDPNDDWEWDAELGREVPWREQLVAETNDRPIGFVQIIDPALEETHYWGNVSANLRAIDIWIGEEQDLGKGLGTQMMKLAIGRCFSNEKVTAILIDPLLTNTSAIRFYECLGFEWVENRVFCEDECAVYKLARDRWTKSS